MQPPGILIESNPDEWTDVDNVSLYFPSLRVTDDEADNGESGPVTVNSFPPPTIVATIPGQRPLPPVPEIGSAPLIDEVIESTLSVVSVDAAEEEGKVGEGAAMAATNNNAFPPLDTSFSNPRGAASPSSATASQINGAGMNNGMPNYVAAMPVGHQQDLNYLFQQIQELSNQLASNRDKVNDITRSAEEVARRANGAASGPEGDLDHEAFRAKVRELEHAQARAHTLIELYRHEQRENTGLIAQYEDALGTATEQIRNYCNDIDARYLAQRRHYNNLLQAEKDEHLQSRLDRDHWQATALRLCEMIRTANRLRSEEWCDEYRVVVALQSEVRCYRRVLGFEPEKAEEEAGWPYLKDAPFNDQP